MQLSFKVFTEMLAAKMHVPLRTRNTSPLIYRGCIMSDNIGAIQDKKCRGKTIGISQRFERVCIFSTFFLLMKMCFP